MSDDDRRLCEIVRTEALRLNDLVGDMLDLTRHKSPIIAPTDLAQIAQEVVSLASRLGRTAQDVTVVYQGPANHAVEVAADASQLRQVIWNLLRNAVQAASPGTRVSVVVNANSRPHPNFQVHDFGAGIDGQAMTHLFDAFYTNRASGTGIGLAVVKRIVDDHQWTIEVDSTESDGTTFTVILAQR
jgi:signal transduction histidine kinase